MFFFHRQRIYFFARSVGQAGDILLSCINTVAYIAQELHHFHTWRKQPYRDTASNMIISRRSDMIALAASA